MSKPTTLSNAPSNRRTRSWLFTPATRPERFGKAAACGADVLIVDLEDAVAPCDKAHARDNVRECLVDERVAISSIAVRINSPMTRFGIDDLILLLDIKRAPDFIMLPKIEGAAQIEQIDALLREAGCTSMLVPVIESARGLRNATSIATASPRVWGLMFGAADYVSDVGAQPHSLTLQCARIALVAAAASTGIRIVDAPCFSLHDAEVLKNDIAFATANGCHAKAAIHPAHVPPINAAFTPSAESIAWAKRVLDAAARGVGIVEGCMVDKAIARDARRVLANA